jgi:5,5'-dehydrodivanillate O-demethylase oxygenase subunit
MMPNVAYASYLLGSAAATGSGDADRMQSLFWYVPIDDTSHLHVMTTAGVPEVVELMKEEQRSAPNLCNDILAVLNQSLDIHKDKERVLRRPDMVRLQDGVTIVGQGVIADRSREHLGATDAGIVLLRKIWRRELAKFSQTSAAGMFRRPRQLRAAGAS